MHWWLMHRCGYPAGRNGVAQMGESVEVGGMQEACLSQSMFNFSGRVRGRSAVAFWWPLT